MFSFELFLFSQWASMPTLLCLLFKVSFLFFFLFFFLCVMTIFSCRYFLSRMIYETFFPRILWNFLWWFAFPIF